MRTLTPVRGLRGEINVPGDKSISHRSVMFGALADGDTTVTNFLESADCLATMECFERLGVRIEREGGKPGSIIVHGSGLHGLCPAKDPVMLMTRNSGTTTRILSGILAPQPFTSILTGDDSVNRRPMKRIIDPLTQMGARIESINHNDCAPLRIQGTSLQGIRYASPVASAQVKSAILCAGLYADDAVSVTEPYPSRDHSERMLRAFGARVEESTDPVTGSHTAFIYPADALAASDIVVPGDISSAAYFIAAACITGASEVLIRHAGTNPTRDGILRVAKAMGADITLLNETDAPEPYADILVRSGPLQAARLSGSLIPTLIDEIPVIAVMAAFAEGTTVIRDAAELKVKESDRIQTVCENLSAMGAKVTPTEDGMVIEGTGCLHGSTIHTHGDHRIAMSFAVAALAAEGETVLDDSQCVAISYPSFFDDLQSLSFT